MTEGCTRGADITSSVPNRLERSRRAVARPTERFLHLPERKGVIPRSQFRWRGLALHLGRGKTPVLTLVQDELHPHLYRIRHPNGWMSTPANIARAKDAAYGHARKLLKEVA